jgi:hypothetical protein
MVARMSDRYDARNPLPEHEHPDRWRGTSGGYVPFRLRASTSAAGANGNAHELGSQCLADATASLGAPVPVIPALTGLAWAIRVGDHLTERPR